LLLPKNRITQIRYFTAIVSARSKKPDAPLNQQVYLRALATIPNLITHYGQFTTHKKRAVRADSPEHDPQFVDIWRTGEKGSDVNLASYLLLDAFQDLYECAVIVSNDSDLVTPAKMVRENLGKKLGIINPHERPSKQLRAAADFFKQIREGFYANRNSQA
jgi:uncharacterized LabA/DUF88 family protein